MGNSFFVTHLEQPHRGRAHAILKAHPDVRRLIGPNPWTALVIATLVCFQLSIAWLIGSLGLGYWWLSVICAWLIGAFANHALYVGIHDAAHDLIFSRRFANKLIAIVADLPNIIPGALAFRTFHLKHHSHQGQHADDLDMPNHFEARVVDNRWYGKAIWLLLFPFVAMVRSFRFGRYVDLWLVGNFLTVLAFDVLIFVYFGANAVLYLVLSFVFALGLHPVGARWVQEHYTLDASQETFSYYGPLNLLSMNVGYHNEHHDIPSIPWNRLPRLRALAPEFYRGLEYHRSWTRLLVRFIFDPKYSIYGRIVRPQSSSADA